MEKITLQVSGMSCEHCERAVKQALGEVPGVEDVQVSLAEGKVDVAYDPAQAGLPALKEAIEEAGYDVV